jgi:hypothetical protein
MKTTKYYEDNKNLCSATKKVSPEINIKKSKSLCLATRITINHKDGSHKNFWKLCSFKEFGNNMDKPELWYINDVFEAQYNHRTHPISQFSIYLHNCYIKTYILFHFVSRPKRTNTYCRCLRRRKRREQVDIRNRKQYGNWKKLHNQQLKRFSSLANTVMSIKWRINT